MLSRMIKQLSKSAFARVVETTYLGRAFILTAKSPSIGSISGHAAAKPS
jgi:hypothetical protein